MTATKMPKTPRKSTLPKAPKLRAINPRPMAFAFDPESLAPTDGILKVSLCRWTPEARKLLESLKKQLKDAPGPKVSLPIKDLRFRVQVRDRGVVRVEPDLGTGFYEQPLLYSRSTPATAAREANAAVAIWAGTVLSQSPLLQVSTRRALNELALAEKAVTAAEHHSPVFQWDINRHSGSARNPKNRNLYTDLAEYAATIVEGHEVYPGAGPMRRVVTASFIDNAVLLMTEPLTLNIGGTEIRFSLGIELSTETYPGRSLPVLQVTHRKHVWARTPKKGTSRIGGYMFPAGDTRALQFMLEKDLSLGEDYLTLASEYGLPSLISNQLAESGTNPGWRGHRLTINHRNGRAESNAALRGVPVLDQLLSFEQLANLLAPHGLLPWQGIQEIATHFGQSTGADMDWKVRFEEEDESVFDDEGRPLDPKSVQKKKKDREKAEQKFGEWLTRVRSDIGNHYAGAHHIVLGYGPGLREDAEAARQILLDVLGAQAATSEAVAGSAIIELKALPSEVHGPRAQLPGAELRPAERAERRTQKWSLFVDEVKRYMAQHTDHPVSGVIVMADLWYPSSTGASRKDDKINKRVGRVILSEQLGVMVQYLLPQERIQGQGINPKKARNFQIRTINAWRDLAWKSIGKMNGLSEKISASFAVPPADLAALTLLGVGVIRVNKKRWSGNTTSFIPYAIELDPQSGTCSGSLMIGRSDGEAKATPMLPLPELVQLLNSNGPSYLVRKRTVRDTNDARSALTQAFIHQIITERAALHPGLIVLADAATLSGMWPWLADSQINPLSITLNGEVNAHMDFPDVSFIRIRSDHAPKVLKDAPDARVKIGDEVRPAAVWSDADLYRITDTTNSMQTYLSFGSRIFKAKRGISSYQEIFNDKGEPTFPRNDAWLTPNAIEITVVRPGNQETEELAKFVEALRSEFAHFGSWIINPGPLHFASLLKDYVPDYELAEEEDDEEETLSMQPGLFD